MSSDDRDEYNDSEEYKQEEFLDGVLEEELRRLSEEPVQTYLARFGDAVQERVDTCRTEAESLAAAGFSGASLMRATVGIEVAIGFFLARPLMQGAFLSEQWAGLLTDKILKPKTSADRTLLPAILKKWDVDITAILLPSGQQMWEQIVSEVFPTRHRYAHAGASATAAQAKLAVDCLDALLSGLVDPMAVRLRLRRNTSGWSIPGTEAESPF